MKPIQLFPGLILLMGMIAGCSAVRITSSWKAPDIVPQTYDKIIVLGIINNEDRSLRERMEDHLVGDLISHGCNAVSAFNQYGPKTFENLTEEQAKDKLTADGIKTVITIVLLDKKMETLYVPPSETPQNQFWDYYQRVYDRILSPGYYQETTKFFWESNLYDLSSSKLIYSVQTQAFDPATTNDLAHEYGLKIVHNMLKNNVLEKPPSRVADAYSKD